MSTSSCGNYLCSGTSCLTTCTADSQCSDTTNLYCTGSTGAPGSCASKKANGATCTVTKECASGNCVDGYCCGSSSCPACQSCNVAGSLGTCTNVADNTADPPNCAANPPCGNTGVCVGGACQQAGAGIHLR